jgi:hypothetical protein
VPVWVTAIAHDQVSPPDRCVPPRLNHPYQPDMR